jgi:hypothetical protein
MMTLAFCLSMFERRRGRGHGRVLLLLTAADPSERWEGTRNDAD